MRDLPAAVTRERGTVTAEARVPTPPFLGTRVVEYVDPDDVYPFINTVALFRGQWELRKGALSDAEYERVVEETAKPVFQRLQRELKEARVLRPAVVSGYFPCAADGNDLIVFDPARLRPEDLPDADPIALRELERFSFPRQQGRQRLCISDFFRPIADGRLDVVAFHCVTMGPRAGEYARELFARNDYTEYLYVHGMGVESAEALAELWHKRIRQELGIAGQDAANMRELFAQGYQGSRYSFGYPACPDMADQEKLFRLLRPDRIGCTLTENFQIDPEQSTSAIIVHHPAARYFNV